MKEQAELSMQQEPQETPHRGRKKRNEKEHNPTHAEGSSQFPPVAMFRSQNSLEDMLDHTAHMIQRFEGFTRGGRLNIAAQDLSDGTREHIRVSEDKHSAGIYATNQALLFTSGFSLM